MPHPITTAEIVHDLKELHDTDQLPHAARAMEHVITKLKRSYGGANSSMIMKVCRHPTYKRLLQELPMFPGDKIPDLNLLRD